MKYIPLILCTLLLGGCQQPTATTTDLTQDTTVALLEAAAAFSAAHIKAAKQALAVEKTAAAALALEHLDLALIPLVEPTPEQLKRAFTEPLETQKVEGMAVRDKSREAINRAAEESRKAALKQAAQDEQDANIIAGCLAAFIPCVIGFGILFAARLHPVAGPIVGNSYIGAGASAALFLGVILIVGNPWTVYIVAGAFALAALFAVFAVLRTVRRAHAATPPVAK